MCFITQLGPWDWNSLSSLWIANITPNICSLYCAYLQFSLLCFSKHNLFFKYMSFCYIGSHCQMLHTLPFEFMLIFYLLLCSLGLLSLPLWYWRKSAVSRGIHCVQAEAGHNPDVLISSYTLYPDLEDVPHVNLHTFMFCAFLKPKHREFDLRWSGCDSFDGNVWLPLKPSASSKRLELYNRSRNSCNAVMFT